MDIKLLKEKLSNIYDKTKLDNIDFSSLNNQKDILSYIYEQISDKKERKIYGQFFTHEEIVQFIVDNLPIEPNSLVLDPACGAGAFLIEILEKTNNNYKTIYGIDIDKKAVELCRLNIELKSNKKVNDNIKIGNTLKNFSLKKFFPDVYNSGGFDVIVGNPPFQHLRKSIGFNQSEPIYQKVLNGVANSATLMIARSYDLLKEGGFLGFVLPKNVARVDSFSKLRDFIIKNSRIVLIYDLGHYFKDVRGDQIILIFQKKKLTEHEMKENKIKISILKNKTPLNKANTYYLTQKDFTEFSLFPIFYNKNIYNLSRKLLGIRTNLNYVTNNQIFRGLNLSVRHEAISENLNTNSVIIHRGDSIIRFGTKYHLYLDTSKLSKIEKKIHRLRKNKIIMQNIFSREGGIMATISNKDELNIDTVTNIISSKVNKLYLLGILNSKLVNFFMIFIMYLVSNFTMHTDRKYIGKIPVVLPTQSQENIIKKHVKRLLTIKNKYSKEFFEEYNKLNSTIYNIYKLSEKEIKIIENHLQKAMSKRQLIWQNE